MTIKAIAIGVFAASFATASLAAGLSSSGFGNHAPTSASLAETVASKSIPSNLKKYFRSHVWSGHRFSKKQRAQLPNPNIRIVDHRVRIGEVYSCSFLNGTKGRYIICD